MQNGLWNELPRCFLKGLLIMDSDFYILQYTVLLLQSLWRKERKIYEQVTKPTMRQITDPKKNMAWLNLLHKLWVWLNRQKKCNFFFGHFIHNRCIYLFNIQLRQYIYYCTVTSRPMSRLLSIKNHKEQGWGLPWQEGDGLKGKDRIPMLKPTREHPPPSERHPACSTERDQ